MPGTIAPSPIFTGFDNDGTPLNGGLLYTYVAGTTTPAVTYSDVLLTVPHSNPIVLDSAGRAIIFLPEASFKFVMRRADNSLVWTSDNVAATNLGQTGGLGEVFVFGGDTATPIVATAYPSGTTFDKLHAGTSVYSVDSAQLGGVYELRGMLLSGDGVVTVTAAIVDLSDGAPDTPLATITSTSATGALVSSGTIAFAAPGAAKNYGIKVKVSAGNGFAWGLKLVRVS